MILLFAQILVSQVRYPSGEKPGAMSNPGSSNDPPSEGALVFGFNLGQSQILKQKAVGRATVPKGRGNVNLLVA